VIAIGDMIAVDKGDGTQPKILPGVAPAAMQQGRYAADIVKSRLEGHALKPFRYHDKGNVATIGRRRAVADLHLIKASGTPAWLLWLGVHLFYLIGFSNRLFVLTKWTISFITRSRGSRLIEHRAEIRS
jgi:NADH dehydrogenase